MDKASVIAIREALDYENNRTVRIAFDNGINLSPSSDIVIWNDDKEIIIGIVADGEGGSYVAGLPIKVICSTYENIQFIMGNTNNDNIDDTLDALKNVVSFTDEDKKNIKEWYKKLYSPNYELSHKNYNPVDIIRD